MSSDEAVKLSAKTWARTVYSIKKVRYSDGVVDGEAESFQLSFDIGYKQGFELGFKLGLQKAEMIDKQQSSDNDFGDPRKINCQICLNKNQIS